MEPTIYKPSIYNGSGIYKNGANGGGIVNKVTIGGDDYPVTKIGNQYWMAKSLKYHTSSFSYANNDTSTEDKCGLLYMYKIVCDEIYPIIPQRWRMPRRDDFERLFLSDNISNNYISIDKGGNNTNGWNDFLSGSRLSTGAFSDFNAKSFYWTDSFKEIEHSSPFFARNWDAEINKNNNTNANDFSGIGAGSQTIYTSLSVRLVYDI